MTRDERVALVARIAGDLAIAELIGHHAPAEATEIGLQILEAAEQAVDAKRGTERDWERLEAQVRTVLMRYDDLGVEEQGVAAGFALVMGGLRKALDALQPKERSS